MGFEIKLHVLQGNKIPYYNESWSGMGQGMQREYLDEVMDTATNAASIPNLLPGVEQQLILPGYSYWESPVLGFFTNYLGNSWLESTRPLSYL